MIEREQTSNEKKTCCRDGKKHWFLFSLFLAVVAFSLFPYLRCHSGIEEQWNKMSPPWLERRRGPPQRRRAWFFPLVFFSFFLRRRRCREGNENDFFLDLFFLRENLFSKISKKKQPAPKLANRYRLTITCTRKKDYREKREKLKK